MHDSERPGEPDNLYSRPHFQQCLVNAMLQPTYYQSRCLNQAARWVLRKFPACVRSDSDKTTGMFSHVVIFWTDPANPQAADELIAGATKHLKAIPGLTHLHIGKMVGSHRPVVDQSYQVALNTEFASKQAQDEYQVHPEHLVFVDKYVKPLVKKVVVYDFE